MLKFIENILNYLRPKPLPASAGMIAGDTALLVIDVQRTYCDPALSRGNDATDKTTARLAKLIPEFRKAGIPVYVVYFRYSEPRRLQSIDFYKFEPQEQDTLIRKTKDSAFEGSDIKNILQRDKRKNIIACGFNLTACVKDTLEDAVKAGFNVELLRDLSANDETCDDKNFMYYEVREMRDKGVKLTTSTVVLQRLLG